MVAMDDSTEDILYRILTELENSGCFDRPTDPSTRRQIVAWIQEWMTLGSPGQPVGTTSLGREMEKKDLFDRVWERYFGIKRYGLLTVGKEGIVPTPEGLEFLLHPRKDYFLGKILFREKYLQSHHREVFRTCFEQFILLPPEDQASVRKLLQVGRGVQHSELTPKDFQAYRRFLMRVQDHLPARTSREVVYRECDAAFSRTLSGTQIPINLPVDLMAVLLHEVTRG